MKRGFTLIEVLVSVSIFAMVMLVATGAVFSIVDANKKAHALKSVMTNLNFALESMAREIRVGSLYGCDTAIGVSGDCVTGGTTFHFKANRDVDLDGSYSLSDQNDQIEYSLVSGRIQKRIYGTLPTTSLITAREISITSMTFYVLGSTADQRQPKVVLTIRGTAGAGKTASNFEIQTTVSQRAIDS
ncbi:MAG TPA: type II secretion system protein [Candidatus Paceibacterota bacterium]